MAHPQWPGQERTYMEIETKSSARSDSPRKAYEKPKVHSEKMFETAALACGKCVSGPTDQYQCGSLLQNS